MPRCSSTSDTATGTRRATASSTATPRTAWGWIRGAAPTGARHVNYGEDRIRAGIRLAPDAAVLLYRMCYASGNTEPGLSVGTTRQSRERVDGYAAGFLDAGAGIVFADGHPKAPGNYLRQLFRTNRTMLEVFRAAPNFHRHQLGPFSSMRSPGSHYALDPDRGGRDPSGFYRSVTGNLGLTARSVTQRQRSRRIRIPRPRRSPVRATSRARARATSPRRRRPMTRVRSPRRARSRRPSQPPSRPGAPIRHPNPRRKRLRRPNGSPTPRRRRVPRPPDGGSTGPRPVRDTRGLPSWRTRWPCGSRSRPRPSASTG